jgi:cellulose synthase/poly-beta-1,6-N-acetylglucosamine synthase-like glycosyltransferase
VRIVNDPAIVSLELAPTTLPALWAQRLRWSQGWFQVTTRHLHGVATSPRLGLRQRLGMVLLLGWREAYPWTSALVLPALVHLALQGRLDDLGVVGLLALVFSWSTTPLLALLTWSRSLPHVRRRWSWWVGYLLLSPLYAELRNLTMRVAVLKELRGERRWVVTPRGATAVRPRVLRVRRPVAVTAPVVPGEPASVVSVV